MHRELAKKQALADFLGDEQELSSEAREFTHLGGHFHLTLPPG